MIATQFWRAVAYNIRWGPVQALVSMISKRSYSIKSTTNPDAAAKLGNLPLAGIKVLDMTRVLAGVIRIHAIEFK